MGIVRPDPHEYNNVFDCKIHQFGLVYRDAVGIFVSHTRDTYIADNELDRGSWSGIAIGNLNRHEFSGTTPGCANPPGEPAYWPRNTEGTRIERNHVRRVCRTLIDGGGIYLTGSHPVSAASASLLDQNYVHDIHHNPYLNSWVPTRNYVTRSQFLFKFSSLAKTLAGQPDPILPPMTNNQGDQWAAATWPVNWVQQCSSWQWPGQDWTPASPSLANRWTVPSVLCPTWPGNAFAPYTLCFGNAAMPSDMNFQITAPDSVATATIQAAGPNPPASFPGVNERIYPIPSTCWSDEDDSGGS